MLQKKASFSLGLVLLLNCLLPTVLLSAPVWAAPAAPALISFTPDADRSPTGKSPTDRLPTDGLPTDKSPTNMLTSQLPNELLEGGRLRIDGSNEMTAINQTLKQRYEKQFPGTEVELRARGTEAALEELQSGEIDLAAIGRPLTAAEKAQGLIEVPVSREKIAIIVGQNNPFQGSLTLAQLSQIFRGEITNWAELGGADAPIRVIDRPEFSDTRLALQQYQIAAPDLTSATVTRLDRDDTVALLDALGQDGISYAIASQLANQTKARPVQLVITQTVLPDDARYPYAQTRGYAYRQDPGTVAQAFLGFAATSPGQSAVAAAKLEEAKAIAAGQQITLPTPPPPALLPDPPAPMSDRRRFLWVLLPLLLIGLLIRWLTQRQAKPIAPSAPSPSTPSTPVPAPVAPSRIESASIQVPADLEADLEADWIEDEPEMPSVTGSEPVAAKVEPLARTPVNEPIFEPVLEPVLEPVSEPVIEPVNELVNEPIFEPVDEPIFEPVDEPVIGPIIDTVTPANRSTVESASELAVEPVSEPLVSEPLVNEELSAGLQVEPPPAEPALPDEVPAPEIVIDAELTPVALGEADLDVAELAAELASVELVVELPSAEPAAEALQSAEAEVAAPDLSVTEIVPRTGAPETTAPNLADLERARSLEAESIVGAPEASPAEPVVAEPIDATLPAAPAAIAELAVAASLEIAPADSLADLNSFADPSAPASDTSTPGTQTVTAEPTGIPPEPELPRLGRGPVKQILLDYLARQGKTPTTATDQELYMALSALLCDRLLSLTTPDPLPVGTRIVGEIAAEYLPGPHLENSLINLGLLEETRRAMQELGLNWQQILDQEEEPGLGRGGLGRLMVCYLDSLATANLPAIGYGIRYEYGIFDQEIQNGWQVEVTDTWLRYGNPWEVEQPDKAVTVQFGGSTEAYIDDQGQYRVRWLPAEIIQGIPYDTPVPGCQTPTVNLLRLWRAEAGDLCKVLYPVDIELQGKALRLKQQFFLVSCALQDALRLHLEAGGTAATLAERFALQINDTDPTLAVAELMRLLVDEQAVPWETAWEVTQATLAYTNHSLMPETLDDLWAVDLVGHFLPRHLEIIYEINYRLLEAVKAKYPDDLTRLNRMSLIDEQGERHIRLNSLACVGCHAVNGVSDLHTDLLKHTVLRDFYELYPEKFSSQTNGVSPRRFLLQANPEFAALITSKIGNGWITDLSQLSHLERYATDPVFGSEWLRIKQAAKQKLAAHIRLQTGIEVNPNSLFDIQAMVIHEYKRQHLNLLHVLTLYNRIKANPNLDLVPRTVIFAGKAAPDYFTAKLMIKLIHAVAEVVNADPEVRGRLKVLFLKDFNIKSAQPIYPAADLAEHISVAGTEAADTGNMIFALNGALIIGTPDGTNLEIRDAVGSENFFQFGLTAQEVVRQRAQGYSPMSVYQANPELKAALDLLTSGAFSQGDTELFRPLVNLLLYYDQYMLLADYAAYLACQTVVGQAYRDTESWTRRSILSTARLGKFSSDRAVRSYCEQIWQIVPADNSARLDYTQAKKRLG